MKQLKHEIQTSKMEHLDYLREKRHEKLMDLKQVERHTSIYRKKGKLKTSKKIWKSLAPKSQEFMDMIYPNIHKHVKIGGQIKKGFRINLSTNPMLRCSEIKSTGLNLINSPSPTQRMELHQWMISSESSYHKRRTQKSLLNQISYGLIKSHLMVSLTIIKGGLQYSLNLLGRRNGCLHPCLQLSQRGRISTLYSAHSIQEMCSYHHLLRRKLYSKQLI